MNTTTRSDDLVPLVAHLTEGLQILEEAGWSCSIAIVPYSKDVALELSALRDFAGVARTPGDWNAWKVAGIETRLCDGERSMKDEDYLEMTLTIDVADPDGIADALIKDWRGFSERDRREEEEAVRSYRETMLRQAEEKVRAVLDVTPHASQTDVIARLKGIIQDAEVEANSEHADRKEAILQARLDRGDCPCGGWCFHNGCPDTRDLIWRCMARDLSKLPREPWPPVIAGLGDDPFPF